MKVIIAGPRWFTTSDKFHELVRGALELRKWGITEVVSGGAAGVDSLGEQWAKENGIDLVTFHANWTKYGYKAGPLRNLKMGIYADCAIIFWDYKSVGTRNMINVMRRLEKPYTVLEIIKEV